MKTNNIEEIKEAIKFKIYEKSVLVFKVAFNSNFGQYEKSVKSGKIGPFAINRETFRSVDKKCCLDGKRTWLYKIAIQELIDEGSLIVSNSYCAAPQHNFSKSYALTVEKLKEVLNFVKVDIKVDDARVKWNESMDFMAGFEVNDTNDKWLSDIYYTPSQLNKAKAQFDAAAKYADYCEKHCGAQTKNWYYCQTCGNDRHISIFDV